MDSRCALGLVTNQCSNESKQTFLKKNVWDTLVGFLGFFPFEDKFLGFLGADSLFRIPGIPGVPRRDYGLIDLVTLRHYCTPTRIDSDTTVQLYHKWNLLCDYLRSAHVILHRRELPKNHTPFIL